MLIKIVIDEIRAVILAVKDLHGFATRIRDARAKKFVGVWGNEGDCTAPLPSHFLELELASRGTEVSGIIRSRNLQSKSELPSSSFIGRRRGFRVTGEITNVSQGRLVCYGKVKMRLRKGMLEIRATDLLADFLPAQASLWQHQSNNE